jgi:hypothetical protein
MNKATRRVTVLESQTDGVQQTATLYLCDADWEAAEVKGKRKVLGQVPVFGPACDWCRDRAKGLRP